MFVLSIILTASGLGATLGAQLLLLQVHLLPQEQL